MYSGTEFQNRGRRDTRPPERNAASTKAEPGQTVYYIGAVLIAREAVFVRYEQERDGLYAHIENDSIRKQLGRPARLPAREVYLDMESAERYER